MDIVLGPESIEAWMFHKDYGVKVLMFGHDLDITHKHFLELVESSIEEDRQHYYEEYMKEDLI